MTVWELAACVQGYNRSQGAAAPVDPPSNEEFDAMVEQYVANQTVH